MYQRSLGFLLLTLFFIVSHASAFNRKFTNLWHDDTGPYIHADQRLYRALIDAIKNQKSDFVSDCVKQMGEPELINSCDNHGFAPIHYAAIAKKSLKGTDQRYDIVDILLKHGANINGTTAQKDAQRCYSLTPLMLAVMAKNPFMIIHLIKKNATLLLESSLGYTAFDFAMLNMFNGDCDSMLALIAAHKLYSEERIKELIEPLVKRKLFSMLHHGSIVTYEQKKHVNFKSCHGVLHIIRLAYDEKLDNELAKEVLESLNKPSNNFKKWSSNL